MSKITFENNKIITPDNPDIAYIPGHGIGPEITSAMIMVMDKCIEKTYSLKRKINWKEISPEDINKAIEEIKSYGVAIKGPLETPVGKGIRSLNVTIRQKLDLFACIRPVKYFEGVSSPVKKPELVDLVIFRENTEDVYAGIEWAKDTDEQKKILNFINELSAIKIRPDSGIGIKPISETASKNIIREAIKFAIESKRNNVTIVHKGNIMKFTEGAFRNWGYELAEKEFAETIITEKDLYSKYKGIQPEDKIVLKDRIADNMLQQILLFPEQYDVIVTTNLNGDYISDLCAAQVGGLGIAPGANIGRNCAVFEATHGTAPNIAGQGKANPCSILLSASMMLDYIGWSEAARKIESAISKAISNKTVTTDLATDMGNQEKVTILKTMEFAETLANHF